MEPWRFRVLGFWIAAAMWCLLGGLHNFTRKHRMKLMICSQRRGLWSGLRRWKSEVRSWSLGRSARVRTLMAATPCQEQLISPPTSILLKATHMHTIFYLVNTAHLTALLSSKPCV